MKRNNNIQDSLYVVFAVFFFTSARLGVFPPEVIRGTFIGGIGVLIFLEKILHVKDLKDLKKNFNYRDGIFSFLMFLTTLYFIFEFPNISRRAGLPNKWDIFFGSIVIGLSLEVTRRKTGYPLFFIGFGFFLYNFAGPILPGVLSHAGFSLSRTMGFLYTSLYGVYGRVTQIFATYVFMFILFGSVMRATGAAKFFVDLPYMLTYNSRGAAAKSAVIASGIMGSVSGSAVANVMTTGIFTIPLIKKSGYKNYEAAAIETAASTGGQLVPPIMGAGAFVMAELTGIPYSRIITVSIIPALLYFFSLMIIVHREGLKRDIVKERIEKEERKIIIKNLLTNGWFYFLPIIFLFVFLFLGYSPVYSAFWAILINIVTTFIFKGKKISFYKIFRAFKEGTENILFVGSAVGTIGIIIGTVYLTGLGLKFSGLILSLSLGYLPLMLVLIALASYVLGMGLTVTSSYIILAVLAAPALIEAGVSLMGAHLIIFWLSQDANITPPVCLAAYSAAGIAKADPIKTGWTSLRYAKVIYIVPLLMAYTPILLEGKPIEVVLWVVISFVGVGALSYLNSWLAEKLEKK